MTYNTSQSTESRAQRLSQRWACSWTSQELNEIPELEEKFQKSSSKIREKSLVKKSVCLCSFTKVCGLRAPTGQPVARGWSIRLRPLVCAVWIYRCEWRCGGIFYKCRFVAGGCSEYFKSYWKSGSRSHWTRLIVARSQNASEMPSKCTRNAVEMLSKFIRNTFEMHSKCFRNALKMVSKCNQNALEMPSKCSLKV